MPTLILIDGLDHIEREQNPDRSLVQDLPLPDQIPEGVNIILGTQKIDLCGLSPRIRIHLEKGRTLVMQSMNRAAIHKLIDATRLGTILSSDQKNKVVQLSDGHPLALIYTINRLSDINSKDEIGSILDATEQYAGHIEENYRVYWDNLKSDHEIHELIALLCRVRGAIDLEQVVSWVGEAVVERFMSQTHHYFHKETDTRWFFFHNSFKQFLLDMTGRNIFNKKDQNKHREYHRQLAGFAAKVSSDNQWGCEEIYHRFCAGEFKKVLELFTQERFRCQYYEFRAFEDIIEDITLCLRAAREEQDGLAVIRAFLIEKELRDRKELLKKIDIPKIVLWLMGESKAIDYVIKGRELRISTKDALEFCRDLIEQGAFQAAQRVFDAAEPLNLLGRVIKNDYAGNRQIEKLKAWAKVAFHFRPLEKLVEVINRFEVEPNSLISDYPSAIDRTRRELFLVMADTIYGFGNDDLLDKFKETIKGHIYEQLILNHLDFSTALDASRGNISLQQGHNALHRLLQTLQREKTSVSDRILIAELLFLIDGNQKAAEEWLIGISQPVLCNPLNLHSEDKSLIRYTDRIRLNRMLAALGVPIDPVAAVPDSDNKWEEGNVLFERMLVIAANIWGQAWRKEYMKPSEVVRKMKPALQFFNRPWQQTRDWTSWNSLQTFAPEYFVFLMHTAEAHGNEAFEAVSDFFEKQWLNEATKNYWLPKWRRRIVIKRYRSGSSKDDLVHHLEELELSISVWYEVYDRIQDYNDQILAWFEIDEIDIARKLLPKILETSFGIAYDKDNQFERWIGWLDRICSSEPDKLIDRIIPFIATQAVLHGTYRGSHGQETGSTLIQIVASQYPGWALELRNWLFEQDGIGFIDAIIGLIRGAMHADKPSLKTIITAIAHLVIPFQRSFDNKLGENLVTTCIQIGKKTDLETLLQPIVNAIETKAYPTNRTEWWSTIYQEICKEGGDGSWLQHRLPTPKQKENQHVHESRLILKTGEYLTESAAYEQVNDYEDLIFLIDQVAPPGDNFNWHRILMRVLNSLTLEQVKTLQNKLSDFKLTEINQIKIVHRLAMLGCNKDKNAINAVFNNPKNREWLYQYGGGLKLEAAKCIIAMEGACERERIFKTLVEDYLSGRRFPDGFLHSLDDLLPILFDKTPMLAVWNELEEHFGQLADFRMADDKPPPPSDDVCTLKPEEMLVNLIIGELLSPVAAVRQEAHKAVCALILDKEEDAVTVSRISKWLAENDEKQAAVLAVLETVVGSRPGYVQSFSDSIKSLCIASSMVVRCIAWELASRLCLKFETMDSEKRQPSPLYEIALPASAMPEQSVFFEKPVPEFIFPDTNDALELLRPLHFAFKALADVSSIPLDNLAARASRLMRIIAPEISWNKAAEKKLFNRLEAADFKVAYLRPRPIIAHRAFSRVVAELYDAHFIGERELNILDEWLMINDPFTSIIEPMKRPGEISIPVNDSMGDYPRNNWIREGEENLTRLSDRLSDGRFVLAELSKFIRQYQKSPEEARFSMICHPGQPVEPKDNQPSHFFYSKSSWSGYLYHALESQLDLPAVIIYARPWFCKNWLALNPKIGQGLGWQPDPSGLFKWRDKNGNVMVESIHWQDGCMLFRDSSVSQKICGKGWLVVATEAALELMKKEIRPADRVCSVVRTLIQKNNSPESCAVTSRELIWS